MMAVVSAVLAFSGGGTRSAWIGALVLFGASYAMAPAMRSLPDKLDGSLAFLTSLPVAPTWLAAAHVATCAGYAAAAAAPLSVAAGLYAFAVPGWSFGVAIWVGFTSAVVLAVTSASALISGVVIRTRMETLAWLPAAALVALVAAGAGVRRVWPEAGGLALAWILQPSSRPRLAWGGALLALTGVWAAFLLLRAGFERWEPEDPGPEGWAP